MARERNSNNLLDMANRDNIGTARAYEILSSIIPKIYLTEDISGDYQSLLKMFAEQFASLKTHTDNLSNISDPENLHNRWLKHFCSNFGFDFDYRDIDNGKWRAFIRNLPRWLRAKGTKDSLETLCRNFGFNPILEVFGDYMPKIGDIYNGPFARKKSTLIYDNLLFTAEEYGSYNNAAFTGSTLDSGIGIKFTGSSVTSPALYIGNVYNDTYDNDLQQSAHSMEFKTMILTGGTFPVFNYSALPEEPWRSNDYGKCFTEKIPDSLTGVSFSTISLEQERFAEKSIIMIDISQWTDRSVASQLKVGHIIRLESNIASTYEYLKIEQIKFDTDTSTTDSEYSGTYPADWRPIYPVQSVSMPDFPVTWHNCPSGYAVMKVIRGVSNSTIKTIPTNTEIWLSDNVGKIVSEWNKDSTLGGGYNPNVVIPWEYHGLFNTGYTDIQKTDIILKCDIPGSEWNDIVFEFIENDYITGGNSSLDSLITHWNDYVYWMGADAPKFNYLDKSYYDTIFETNWNKKLFDRSKYLSQSFYSGKGFSKLYSTRNYDYDAPGSAPTIGYDYGTDNKTFTKKQLLAFSVNVGSEVPIGIEVNSRSFLQNYSDVVDNNGFGVAGLSTAPDTGFYDTNSEFVSGNGHTVETKWPNKTSHRNADILGNGIVRKFLGTTDGSADNVLSRPISATDVISMYAESLSEAHYNDEYKMPPHKYGVQSGHSNATADFRDIDGYAGGSGSQDSFGMQAEIHTCMMDGWINAPGEVLDRVGWQDSLWKSWEASVINAPITVGSLEVKIRTHLGYQGCDYPSTGSYEVTGAGIIDCGISQYSSPINAINSYDLSFKPVQYIEMGIDAPNGVIFENENKLCELGIESGSDNIFTKVRGDDSNGAIIEGWPWSYYNPTDQTIRLKDPVTGEYLSETSKHFNIPPGRVVVTFRNNVFEQFYDYNSKTVYLTQNFNPIFDSSNNTSFTISEDVPNEWDLVSEDESPGNGDLLLIGNGLYKVKSFSGDTIYVYGITSSAHEQAKYTLSNGIRNIVTAGDPTLPGSGNQVVIRKVENIFPLSIVQNIRGESGRTFLLNTNPREYSDSSFNQDYPRPLTESSLRNNQEYVTIKYKGYSRNYAESPDSGKDLMPICYDFYNDFNKGAGVFDQIPQSTAVTSTVSAEANFYANFNSNLGLFVSISHYKTAWTKWSNKEGLPSLYLSCNALNYTPGEQVMIYRYDSLGNLDTLLVGKEVEWNSEDRAQDTSDGDTWQYSYGTDKLWLNYKDSQVSIVNSAIGYSHYTGGARFHRFVDEVWPNSNLLGDSSNWIEGKKNEFKSKTSNKAGYKINGWPESIKMEEFIDLFNPNSGGLEGYLNPAGRFVASYYHEIVRANNIDIGVNSDSAGTFTTIVEGDTYNNEKEGLGLIVYGRNNSKINHTVVPYIDSVYSVDNGDIPVNDVVPQSSQPLIGGYASFTGGTDDSYIGITIGMSPSRSIGTLMQLSGQDPAIKRRGLGRSFSISILSEENPGIETLEVAKKYIDKMIPVDVKFDGFTFKNYSGVAIGSINPATGNDFGTAGVIRFIIPIQNFIIQHPETPGGQGYLRYKYSKQGTTTEYTDYLYDVSYPSGENDGDAIVSIVLPNLSNNGTWDITFELLNNNGTTLGSSGVSVSQTFVIS